MPVGLTFFTPSGIPAWKRLISHPHGADERISLITEVFNHGETQAVRRLTGDDAQSFVDVIDEVFPDPFVTGEWAH